MKPRTTTKPVLERWIRRHWIGHHQADPSWRNEMAHLHLDTLHGQRLQFWAAFRHLIRTIRTTLR